MNLPKFLYYILTKDGRSAKVVNKTVTFVGSPTHLPQTPDGWQQILLAWERANDLHGLSGSFSLNLGYVLDACRICTDTAYRHTTEKELFLLINQLKLIITPGSPIKYKWLYKYFHKQEINLSECEDERDMFKAPLMPGGIDKLIKANWDTVYKFPLNVPEAINLFHEGILLTEKANYIVVDGFDIAYSDYGEQFFLPFSFINNEGRSSGIFFQSQDAEGVSALTYADKLLSTNFWSIAAPNNVSNVTLRIKGTLYFTAVAEDASVGFRMRFLRSNLDIGNQNDYEIWDGSAGFDQGRTYTVDVDLSIPMMPGERAYLEGIFFGSGFVNSTVRFEPQSKLSVEFDNKAPTTTYKCFKRSTLYKKLIGAITGDEANAVSELCESFDFLLLTCGDSIRGLDNPILETSLSDFVKDTDATLMAGFDIFQDKARLENREIYYADEDEVDLGEVTDFVKKPAKDKKCNTFKVGHQKQTTEDVNGKYGPNGNNLFTGPLTKDVKEYNIVSPYKADPYEIESRRIGLDGKNTTDNESDKDIFVIVGKARQTSWTSITVGFIENNSLIIVPVSVGANLFVGQQIRITGSTSNDGVYDIVGLANGLFFYFIAVSQALVDETDAVIDLEVLLGEMWELDRPAYDTLEGVPTDTVFNLPYLTPKAMLRRHKRWIAGMNAGLLSNPIKFSSGKENQNIELKTVLAGVTTDEDADEYISNPMFLPWYFIFKTRVPIDLPELLEANPNRIFKFTDEYGNVFKGFIQMCGIAPNEYTPQEFRLLAAPDNDLTLLIHG